jgi:2-polyprenyl-6-methoxyphenol hydroxylase-like FAD-dependent oxidoreductase
MNETFDVAIAGGAWSAPVWPALQPLGPGRADRVGTVSLDAQPSFMSAPLRYQRISALYQPRALDAIGGEAPIRASRPDQGRFGFARIDAREQGVAALGFVVANRVLGAALWGRLAGGSGLEIFCPAHVDEVTRRERDVELRVTKGDGTTLELRARLLVAADGAQSSIRSSLGIDATVWDYEQTAIVTNVATRRFHDHVAYERFTPPDLWPSALPTGAALCGYWRWRWPNRRSNLLRGVPRALQRFGFRLGASRASGVATLIRLR